MIISGPQPTNTDAHKMHMRAGRSQGRTTLRRYKHSRAKAQPFVSPYLGGGPTELTAISNRDFEAWVGHNWKHVLSVPNRTAWNNLAALTPVQDYRGNVRTFTGMEFFSWYEKTWAPAFYSPCTPFFRASAIPDVAPTLPWAPPAAPTLSAIAGWTDFSVSLTFICDAGLGFIDYNCLAPAPRFRSKFTNPHSFVRVLCNGTEAPPNSGTYIGAMRWDGVLPAIAPGHSLTFRIRVLGTNSPFSISDQRVYTITRP